jgi:NADP-reducing hydrogenase subunit HndB
MAKLSIEELDKLREKNKSEMAHRSEGTIELIVGMGTCGIAAGAKETIEALNAAIKESKLSAKVEIRPTGCMGLCYVEPTVEVFAPGMPTVIYGKVNAETARDIVKKHLVEGSLLDGHIYDRPAVDIIKK